jgi:hypothetical protein
VSLTIYLWRKPGEDRVYMSQAPIPPDRRVFLRSQGYRIYALPVVFEDDDVWNALADQELPRAVVGPVTDPWYLGVNVQNSHGTRGTVVQADERIVRVRWFSDGRRRVMNDIGTFDRERFEKELLPAWKAKEEE